MLIRLSLALALLVMLLAGCAPKTAAITGTDATRVACSAFQPIWFSARDDSELTISQIMQHNNVFDALCSEPEP